MSILTTTNATERLTRRLQAAGLDLAVVRTSGDVAGRYLLIRTGGRAIAGLGWTIREATEIVERRIAAAAAGHPPGEGSGGYYY